MCGRYVLFSPPEQLVSTAQRRLNGQTVTVIGDGPAPSYNIAPTHQVPVLRLFNGSPTIGPAQWGYPPKTIFNARGETVFEKPVFQGSTPCVFILDGWFEWVEDDDPQPDDNKKQPWLTQDVRQDGTEPIFVAGICKIIDGTLYSSMVTTEAVPSLRWLHHRMPRLLVGNELEKWLTADGSHGGAVEKRIAAEPPAAGVGTLESRKVSKAVGNVANNSPANIQTNGSLAQEGIR